MNYSKNRKRKKIDIKKIRNFFIPIDFFKQVHQLSGQRYKSRSKVYSRNIVQTDESAILSSP